MDLTDLRNDFIQSLDDFERNFNRTQKLLCRLKQKHTTKDHLDGLSSENLNKNLHYICRERNIQYLIQKKLIDISYDIEQFCRFIDAERSKTDALIPTNFINISNNDKQIIYNTLNKVNLEQISETNVQVSGNDNKTQASRDDLPVSKSNTISTRKQNVDTDIIHKVLLHNEKVEQAKHERIKERTNMPDLNYKTVNPVNFQDLGFIKAKRAKEKCTPKKSSREQTPNEERHEIVKKVEFLKPQTPLINAICGITYIISPSEFYIAVGKETFEKIQNLNEELHNFYTDSKAQFDNKAEAMKLIKGPCVAFSSMYDAWYRATLYDLQPKKNDGTVIVKFVDYGNTESIPLSNLRSIEEKFCQLPIFAHKCHLAYLYPTNWKKGDDRMNWSYDVIVNFKAMFQDTMYVLTFVASESFMDMSLAVDLLPSDDSNDKSIGDIMLANGMAIEILDNSIPSSQMSTVDSDVKIAAKPLEVKDMTLAAQILKSQGHAGIRDDMSDAEKLEIFFKNENLRESATMNEAIANYDAKDEQRICKFMLSGKGKCSRAYCKYEHTNFSKDQITTDKEEVYHDVIKESMLPEQGNDIRLKVTCVRNACQFYAVAVGEEAEESVAAATGAEACAIEFNLDRLLASMNRKETIKTYEPVRVTPSIGQMVLVYYDCNWLRGKVIDYVNNANEVETYEIFLVDYGDKIEATLTELKKINKDFLSLPFQAILCYLSNVYINENSSVEDGKTFFESRYLCETLNAHVVSSNLSSLEVILYDIDQQDISEKVVAEGYAVKGEWSFKSKSSLMLID